MKRSWGLFAGVVLLITGLGAYLLFGVDTGGTESPGAEARADRTRAVEGASLDLSVLRPGRRYGIQGAAHAKLDLSLRVTEETTEGSGSTQPVSGATVLVDDAPVGISDESGRLTISVPVSDSGEARHVVWAEAAGLRSSPIAFAERAWPDRELTLLLRGSTRVEGLVLGPEGEPAAGASVTIDPPVAAPVNTDVRGRFTFSDLPPGAYWLEAWRQGAGVRLPLRAIAGRSAEPVLRLQALGRIEGVVVDAEDAPVPEAAVTLLARSSERVLARQQTDAEGRFDLGPTLLQEGALRAQKAGAQVAVFVSPPYHPLRLRLQRTGIVEGQVLRADGTPARGASVLDHSPFVMSVGGDGVVTATGPQARYRLEAVAEEVTALHVTSPGQGIYQKVDGLRVRPGEVVVFDLTLEAKGRAIEGLVRDKKSAQGIEGVALELMPVKGGMAFAESTLYARTDARGRFEIQATDAESFLVTATHPRYRDHRGFLSVEAPTLELTLGRRIFGEVVDETRVPLARFQIGARQVDDPLGRFDLAVDLEASEIEVSALGMRPRTLPLLEEGAIDLGTIVLEAAPLLRVRVLTHDGAPAAGATIYRFVSGWGEPGIQSLRGSIGTVLLAVAVTDPLGVAQIPAPGERECVGALLPGHGPTMRPPCGRPPEGGGELVLHLAPEAVLEGSAGEGGRSVIVAPEEIATVADEAGHYRVGGLGPGVHGVTFREGAGQPRFFAMRSIKLLSGETSRLDLIDAGRGALRVTLRADTDEIIFLKLHELPTAAKESAEPAGQPAGWQRARAVMGLHGERVVLFEGLVAGPTRVVASVRDRSAQADTVILASETVDLAISAPKLEP